jgi:hypothetical protein
MAQFVLINAIGTRRAGEVLDSVQDGQAVITQLAAFGGVLVPLPNATLQPYIDAAQLAYDRADSTQAQNIMLAGYASTTAIAGGGTAGTIPIWTAGSVLGDSVLQQAGALVGVNVAPTASLSLPGGLAAAASMNFATGVAPAAPNSGDLWFDGTYLYLRAAGINQPLNAPFGTGTPNVLTKWSSVSGLTDTAITEASGAITTLALTNPGAGATNGTYSQVALTTVTGTGTGATADIVVAGNVVTSIKLRAPGTGYVAGNTLSTAAIGGAGFVFTVSAVSASDNASGNVTALRIGAGTPNPVATLDALGLTAVRKLGFYAYNIPSTNTKSSAVSGLVVDTSGESTGVYAVASDESAIRVVHEEARIDASANTSGASIYGGYFGTSLVASGGGTAFVRGVGALAAASDSTLSGRTFVLYGLDAQASVGSVGTGNTISFLYGGFFSTLCTATSGAQAITTRVGVSISGGTFQGAAHTIASYYAIRIAAPSLSNGSTITSAWGVSQEYATSRNAFYGNFGVGNALDVGTGKVIASLTLTNGGTGYTNATYSQVALTTVTGSGSGATADIIVAGGIVTTVVLRAPGQGYAVGDTLSSASIGAGANFLLTVATTASILRSDGTVVGNRLGGGTTIPRAALDVVNGAIFDGSQIVLIPQGSAAASARLEQVSIFGTIAPTATTPQSISSFSSTPYYDLTNYTGTVVYNLRSNPEIIATPAALNPFARAVSASFTRRNPGDLSTTGTYAIGSFGFFTSSGVGSTTTGNAYLVEAPFANNVSGHTVSVVQNFRSTNIVANGATVTTLTQFYGAPIGSTGGTITTHYGLRLEASTTPTITNRWAISTEDPLSKSRHYGNFGVGNVLDVGAGKVIASLTLTNAGAGATNGTYIQAALTGGTGTGATADIVVAGNVVTSLILRNPGQGYAVGDTLSTAAIGGAGFVFTVATIASILRSDGTSVATRIGAGITSPSFGVDSLGGIAARAATLQTGLSFGTTNTSGFAHLVVDSSGESGSVSTVPNGFTYYGVRVQSSPDFTAATSSQSAYAGMFQPNVQNGAAAATITSYGVAAGFRFGSSTITGRTFTAYGVLGSVSMYAPLGAGNTFSVTNVRAVSVVSPTNAQTFTSWTEFFGGTGFSGAAHTITTYYGLQLSGPTLSGGATVTNRWSMSVEDSLARSRHYGNFGVGNALDVGAGKIIASLTLTAGGTLYTNGTYAQVALTGGTGTGATADIVISGNAVTTVVLRNPGQGYVVGDVLSVAAASVGGTGSGFQATVATTASILRSDGTVVAPRFGAGTTSAEAPLHVVGGAAIRSAGLITSTAFTGLNAPMFAQLVIDSANEPSGNTVLPATTPTTASYYDSIFVGTKFDFSLRTGSSAAAGIETNPQIVAATAAGTATLFGVFGQASLNSTSITGKTISLIGVGGYPNAYETGAGNTISAITGVQSVLSVVGGLSGSFTPLAVTTAHGFRLRVSYTSAAHTITTHYGLRLDAPTVSGGATITNRWAISQEDALAKSTHYGNFGVGNALDVGAGKIIASLTLTNAGAGATNGTYIQAALTGGTGTGATADIVVAGNVVTSLVLRNPGQGYTVGDTLSTAAIGGAGFVFTVASTASILRSDGSVVAPRVGAGTTAPITTSHVNGAQIISGIEAFALDNGSPTFTNQFVTASLVLGGRAAADSPTTATNQYLVCFGKWDVRSAPTTSFNFGGRFLNRLFQSNAGQTVTVSGVQGSAARDFSTGDDATAVTVVGGTFNAQANRNTGSSLEVTGIEVRANNFLAGHTVTTHHHINLPGALINGAVTTFYGLRMQAPTGTGVITNRYPIAQEDTLGSNYVRAKTFFGAAVGTAAATTASVEITAQGTLNGDLRLNSANAVVDVSAASSNGVKFNNRGGAGITSTTQLNYEEGTYTPTLSAGWTATAGNYSGTWTRNGRLVTLTIQFTGGTNSGATGGSTISTPVGLTPVRNGAGTAVNVNGTALGNGVVVVTTAATIINANAITTTTVDKTIVVQYEV